MLAIKLRLRYYMYTNIHMTGLVRLKLYMTYCTFSYHTGLTVIDGYCCYDYLNFFNMNNTSLLHCSFLAVSWEQTKDTFIASILTSIINAVFSLMTTSGNFVILYVIWKKQELHSPSFILLFSLAASDLVVGVICQPFFVAYHTAELMDNFNAYCVLRIIQRLFSYTAICVSLATLSGISIDRLLALTLHLRYNTVVTFNITVLTNIAVWIGSVAAVLLNFWMSTAWILFSVAGLLLTFFVTALSTFKIFQVVRRHQRQISQQQRSVQRNNVNVFKFRKSSVTVLYVYGLILIFYLPLLVTLFVYNFTEYTARLKITYDCVATVVFIGSFLKPLVYYWRMREIRRAVKNVFRINQNEELSFWKAEQ